MHSRLVELLPGWELVRLLASELVRLWTCKVYVSFRTPKLLWYLVWLLCQLIMVIELSYYHLWITKLMSKSSTISCAIDTNNITAYWVQISDGTTIIFRCNIINHWQKHHKGPSFQITVGHLFTQHLQGKQAIYLHTIQKHPRPSTCWSQKLPSWSTSWSHKHPGLWITKAP